MKSICLSHAIHNIQIIHPIVVELGEVVVYISEKEYIASIWGSVRNETEGDNVNLKTHECKWQKCTYFRQAEMTHPFIVFISIASCLIAAGRSHSFEDAFSIRFEPIEVALSCGLAHAFTPLSYESAAHCSNGMSFDIFVELLLQLEV